MTEHGMHTTGVDHSLHGLTELRVHGVSGTPAAAMLDHPEVLLDRLSGDRRAGFCRRWYPGGTTPDSDAGRIEAYSWGGLTSGPASRALWLLFLPFVLVDLAHWMLPPMAENRVARSARLASTTMRLVALSLTFTFLVAISVVTLDLAAWQCAPVDRCARHLPPLGWVADLEPGARLAIAALIPALIVIILWRLGRQDLRGGQSPPGPAVEAHARPLASPTFWNGDLSELRLRALHISAWSSALGALVLAPTLQVTTTDLGSWVVGVLLAFHLAVLAACVVVTCSERITGRGGEGAPKSNRPLNRLRWGSLALLGTGLVAAAVVPTEWPTNDGAFTSLPYLRAVVPILFYVQVGLLLVLAAAVCLQRPWTLGRENPGFAVALRGLAAPATAFSAWLVAVTFGVGMGLATAKYLGVAVNSSDTAVTNLKEQMAPLVDPLTPLDEKVDVVQGIQTPLVVPPGYFWTGTAVVVMLAALLVLVLATVLYVRRATNRLALDVLADYPGQRAPERARSVARGRVLAGLTDNVDQLVGPLLLVAFTEVVVGSVLFAVSALDTVEGEGIGTATAFGVYLTGLAAAGLVSLGFLAFRDARVRRYVGILWDVATFWPRANHPLTPPCYGERAVPELARRTARLTAGADDLVILSAHSQGSVLAAAMLMRPQPGAGRVALLTYGAPLRRLYARFFPAYFGPGAFSDVQANTQGRWLNLWAPSDPIGAWVLTEEGTVDVQVHDPSSLEPDEHGALPGTCGHSGYPDRDEYAAALRFLVSD